MRSLIWPVMVFVLSSCIGGNIDLSSILGDSSGVIKYEPSYAVGYKEGSPGDFEVEGNYLYTSFYGGLTPFRVYDRTTGNILSECKNCQSIGAFSATKVGNLVYISGEAPNGDATMEIINVANVNSVSRVGSYVATGSDQRAYAVHVNGNYAYLSIYTGELAILDISNPANIQKVSSYTFSKGVEDSFRLGNYLYVAVSEDGLQILDVSNISSPSLVGSFPSTYADQLIVSGSTVYLADWTAGIKIIDVTTPSSPSLLGSFATAGDSHKLQVDGNYMYVADRYAGVQVLDISNPASISAVGSIANGGSSEDGNTHSLEIDGTTLFAMDSRHGLREIDISTPTSPSLVSDLSEAGRNRVDRIKIDGNRAYLGSPYGGMVILDISDLSNPIELGSFRTSSWVYGIDVAGNYAYIGHGASGLVVVDISNPASPSQVSQYNTPGWAVDVKLSGNHAYVADNTSVQIIDISNPLAVSFVTSIAAGTGTYKIEIHNQYLYIAENAGGLGIYDISNPASPSLVSNYPAANGVNALSIDGDTAYIIDGAAGVNILDLSNISSPSLKGNIPLTAGQDILFHDGRLYVGESDKSVNIYVMSSSGQASLISDEFFPGDTIQEMEIVGSNLFLANFYGGLKVFQL